MRLPSDAVKRDTLTSLAAGGGCTAATCEAVGLANKLTTPNEVLTLQIPVMPLPLPEVAAAPAASASAASVAVASGAAPLAAAVGAADGPGPAAELVALQAQLAALKAAAGQQ